MRKLLTPLCAILLCCSTAFSALDVRSVWEVNTAATAGNVNGGGFNPYGVTNMLADLECTSGTTSAPSCGSVTYTFIDPGDVGHWLFISSGTGFTANQFCQIASISSGRAVLTATAGTCSVITAPGSWTTNSAAGVGAASPSVGVFSVDRSRATGSTQTSTTATNTAGVLTVGSLTYNKSYIGNILQIRAGAGATQGWYEITNSTAGVSFTLDRDPSGTTNITLSIGGALSFGSSTANRTDDTVMELLTGTNGTGGSMLWVTGTTITLAVSLAVTADGGSQAPVKVIGYGTVRGAAAPTGSSRPTFNTGTFSITLGDNYWWSNIISTGTTNTTVFVPGINTVIVNSSFFQTSTTTGRIAMTLALETLLNNVEAVSYFGSAITVTNVAVTIENSYIHDSRTCFSSSATTQIQTLVGNLFVHCSVTAIDYTGGMSSRTTIDRNTVVGAVTKLGVGLAIATGGTDFVVQNNILYGLVSGITHADTQNTGYDNYNNYFNNTTDVVVAKWQKGPNDLALDPVFSRVAQVSFTTATYAGTTLTCSGCDFTNVTNGTFVYLATGSGLTTANSIAKVNSHTTTTLVTDIDIGESSMSDWTGHIITGLNFIPTVTTLAGFPGTMQGGLAIGFQTIGAIQPSAAGSGGIVTQ